MNVKEEVLESLEGRRKITCPNCNHGRFKRVEEAFCSIWEEDEGISDEDITLHNYKYFCSNCNEELWVNDEQ